MENTVQDNTVVQPTMEMLPNKLYTDGAAACRDWFKDLYSLTDMISTIGYNAFKDRLLCHIKDINNYLHRVQNCNTPENSVYILPTDYSKLEKDMKYSIGANGSGNIHQLLCVLRSIPQMNEYLNTITEVNTTSSESTLERQNTTKLKLASIRRTDTELYDQAKTKAILREPLLTPNDIYNIWLNSIYTCHRYDADEYNDSMIYNMYLYNEEIVWNTLVYDYDANKYVKFPGHSPYQCNLVEHIIFLRDYVRRHYCNYNNNEVMTQFDECINYCIEVDNDEDFENLIKKVNTILAANRKSK